LKSLRIYPKYTQGAKDVKTGNLKRNVISSFAINMVNDI